MPSPAKDASATGDSAAYRYSLKNRPYTVRIIKNASTVITRQPSSVTSHSGMLARKPTSSMADAISVGSDTVAPSMPPTLPAAAEMIPAQTAKMSTIRSMP